MLGEVLMQKNLQAADFPGTVGGKCCAIVFGGAIGSPTSSTNPVVCTEIFTG